MSLSTMPFEILRDLASYALDTPARRKRERILKEKQAYLADCKARGVSPYEGLDAFLADQDQRYGIKRGE